MPDFAVLWVVMSLVAGLCLAAYHFWKHRERERGLMLFFLPVLAYFILHFSVEAYNWGEVWRKAQSFADTGTVLLETSIAAALVDIKLLLSILLLLVWIYVWKSVDKHENRKK